MQLTSTTGTMVVDYFPVAGSTKFIYKVLKFQGVDVMSTKCITKSEFEYECDERIGLGYEVTGFNTQPANVNPMMGAC
jgi:hypothetical protein